MTRLITSSARFGRQHRQILRRFELKGWLVREGRHALPGLVVSAAELIKYHDNEEVVSDLTMFDIEGRRWWVGKIFTRFDDFRYEVLLPVHRLRRTGYLVEDADSICESVDQDWHADVREIVLEETPGVVVFVSNPQPEWYQEVADAEGQLAVLERFASSEGEKILRVNGELPQATGHRVSSCRSLPGLPQVIKAQGLASDWPTGVVDIAWHGELLEDTARIAGKDIIIHAPPAAVAPTGEMSLWRITDRYYSLREEPIE